MPIDDDGFSDYPNAWTANTRFMNCIVHYAEQREGEAWSQVIHRSYLEIHGERNEEVILRGGWGRYRKQWKLRSLDIYITEDYEAKTCTAIDSRNLYPSERWSDVIITVPTNKKKPDKQVVKLLDAVEHYLAGIKQ